MVSKPKTVYSKEDQSHEEIGDFFEIPGRHTRIAGGIDAESHCCAFSHDGRLFAWSIGNGFVRVLRDFLAITHNHDLLQQTNSSWLSTIDCAKNVHVMQFSRGQHAVDTNGNNMYRLATGSENGRIKIWNALTGEMVLNLSDHYSCIKGLSFTCSGEPLLVSCSIDKSLKIWDLGEDGNMTLTMADGHKLPVYDCSFSPCDPTLICSVGAGKAALIWKLVNKRSCKVYHHLKGHYNDVVSCSWSPDGALVATASHDTMVIVWDPQTGGQLFRLGHLYPPPEPIFAGGANGAWVKSVSFSPDGCEVATLCEDDNVRVWPLWSDRQIVTKNLRKPGNSCRFSPLGSSLAIVKSDGSATIVHRHLKVMTLSHLCRLSLRRVLSSSELDRSPLPAIIKRYLKYCPTNMAMQ